MCAWTTKTFSRYDFDGLNRVDAVVPGDQTSEGFDWVDEDTIIYTSYSPSANRKRLSLATVVAEPFSVIADTTWNANGYVTTSVSTRIRNVRVGDVYSGYAYYGDAGQNNNPNFYAINLGTGEETLLGNAGQLTGGGSFGIWTVIERGGKLYVQTTDNGIQVYEMASATSLGALQTTYTKEDLDTATGYTGQYWGLDVLADGRTFVVGDAQGRAHELAVLVVESIELEIERSGGNVVISWPESVEGAVLQASSSVSAGGFEDMDPQPAVVAENGRLSVTLPVDEEMQFFRLRK